MGGEGPSDLSTPGEVSRVFQQIDLQIDKQIDKEIDKHIETHKKTFRSPRPLGLRHGCGYIYIYIYIFVCVCACVRVLCHHVLGQLVHYVLLLWYSVDVTES